MTCMQRAHGGYETYRAPAGKGFAPVPIFRYRPENLHAPKLANRGDATSRVGHGNVQVQQGNAKTGPTPGGIAPAGRETRDLRRHPWL